MYLDPNKPNGALTEMRAEVLEWLDNGDTGVSSKGFAMAAVGVRREHLDFPSDPSDFNRCAKMIEACPSIKNLEVVKEIEPSLAPFIDNWNVMADFRKKAMAEKKTNNPELHDYINNLARHVYFLRGKILYNCLYWNIADFTERTGIEVTLANLDTAANEALSGYQARQAEKSI